MKNDIKQHIKRQIRPLVVESLDRGKSILLLGPRQTGKTTLISSLDTDLSINLIRPQTRHQYEKHPDSLFQEIESLEAPPGKRIPLVAIDEIQKVPMLLDSVQDLIDRNIAQFVLSGSSARKLRRSGIVNMLPGRVVNIRLDPITYVEHQRSRIEDILLYGALPGIILLDDARHKDMDLESYVTTYLDDEIRAETRIRKIGSFSRFLELAASEVGQPVNFQRLSQDVGVSHRTIAAYYEVLEDCLIAERIDPLIKSSTRRRLTRSSQYLFFDQGVQRIAARLGTKLTQSQWGHRFEQYIGLELLRLSRHRSPRINVHFWRDPSGPEVDWVLDHGDSYSPIEVKWTTTPKKKDARHLELFLGEYAQAKQGWIVCQIPRPQRISAQITAIPWQQLNSIFHPLDRDS